jgi:hypothetical protein
MPDPLTDLAEKAKRATPGPWGTDEDEWSHGVRPYHDHAGPIIATWDNRHPADEQHRLNAAYIAACSPERILALVERVREESEAKWKARKRLQEAESQIAELEEVAEAARVYCAYDGESDATVALYFDAMGEALARLDEMEGER